MKDKNKLIKEILKDVKHDMSDEEILSLLADSRVSENTDKQTKKSYTIGQRIRLQNSRVVGRSFSRL